MLIFNALMLAILSYHPFSLDIFTMYYVVPLPHINAASNHIMKTNFVITAVLRSV